jgi:serine/threonine protein phosphatase PrpC
VTCRGHDQNEVRLLADPQRGLASVADGMGGRAAGGRVLLCSDGLADPLAEGEIEAPLHSRRRLAQVGHPLIERADAACRSDAATVVVVEPAG